MRSAFVENFFPVYFSVMYGTNQPLIHTCLEINAEIVPCVPARPISHVRALKIRPIAHLYKSQTCMEKGTFQNWYHVQVHQRRAPYCIANRIILCHLISPGMLCSKSSMLMGILNGDLPCTNSRNNCMHVYGN